MKKLKYCEWDDEKSKKTYIKKLVTLYTIFLSLTVIQNSAFSYLLLHVVRDAISFTSFMVMIFASNSIANLAIFITLYILIYWNIPLIISKCKDGLLKRDAIIINKHKLAIIVGIVIMMVFISIIRVYYYYTNSFNIGEFLFVLHKLFLHKHPYIETGGYLIGALAVLGKTKKRILPIHIISYVLLLIAAYYEASIAF